MAELYNAGRIQISVSARELKYKDGQEVTVFKNIDGVKTPTAKMIFSGIETMKQYLSQEQIETLACANHLVRCQNIARSWDKPKTDPLEKLIRAKGYDEEKTLKIKAYLEKLDKQ